MARHLSQTDRMHTTVKRNAVHASKKDQLKSLRKLHQRSRRKETFLQNWDYEVPRDPEKLPDCCCCLMHETLIFSICLCSSVSQLQGVSSSSSRGGRPQSAGLTNLRCALLNWIIYMALMYDNASDNSDTQETCLWQANQLTVLHSWEVKL